MNLDQRLLARTMSDMSEGAYCAGWIIDLEYDLWAIITGSPDADPTYALEQQDIDDLKTLSERARGWIVWTEDKGETFVPMDQWLAMYAAHKTSAP
jgi:hypothetical protein